MSVTTPLFDIFSLNCSLIFGSFTAYSNWLPLTTYISNITIFLLEKNRFSTCYIMMQSLICMLWLDFGIQSSTALLLQNLHRIVTSEFNYMAIFWVSKSNLKCKRLSFFWIILKAFKMYDKISFPIIQCNMYMILTD